MKSIQKFTLSVVSTGLLLVGCNSDDPIPPLLGQCSTADELNQFYNYMNDNYFWNDDMPANVSPGNYSNVYQLLEALVVPEDRFSFILTEDEYQSRFVNAEYVGFGFSSRQVGNQVFINYVYADSPADLAGIKRSDELTHINGESVQTLIQQGRYDQALGSATVGVTLELTWRDRQGISYTEAVSKELVETNTVLAAEVLDIDGRDVGYYVLNTFINRTGSDLNNAYNQFTGVDELIIDVRYNTGGLTRYANQASTQAAGNNVIGEVFTKYLFNSNNTDMNFIEQFQLYDGIRQLNLDRVYVLTTASSCSSSELLINSLDPFVEVVVIGEPTCGKPVGQIPERLCDKRTFVVNFETVNALDQGRYFDGLAPNCSASDQLVGDWASPDDPMLQAAAYHMIYNQCQAVGFDAQSSNTSQSSQAADADFKPNNLAELWRSEH
ncbi:S41 family peptidase [Pseudidiomarina woesei]|uniref:C-terminal processing protease CtpA/Prc, contains a PDZ domain n=1 Tax=Pseudidiomarina woesei TaxID=1381080 RepID=A0A0K6HBW6_9GAMM|nr:S41 family peptidase [Pseudidiomarina woesei]CUA88372.1 C-terminal processing protease CtpA/Prc, contains a PDZ domain [Pseudidiomarina woesei]